MSTVDRTTHTPVTRLARWASLLGLLILCAVVLVTFSRTVQLSFVGDDWIFFDLAGRLSLHDYLVKYLDPRVQTAWYRPVQGILFRIGYIAFGQDQLGYHLVNVLIHLANALLLFALLRRVVNKWQTGLLAAFLFATFPIAVEAVFKPGVIDPLTTTLTLVSVWFWMEYLVSGRARAYWLTFAAFVLALLTKEIAVTLPVTLFLVDWLLIAKPAPRGERLRRYVWFAVVWVLYAPLEYVVVRRSVFLSQEGYQASVSVFSTLVDYLAGLAFPWRFSPPWSYAWLALVGVALAYLVVVRRAYGMIPLVVGAVLSLLPIVAFPAVSFRFLYLALTASAIGYALLGARLWEWLAAARVYRPVLFGALVALAVSSGSVQISHATAEFAEFARVSRVTFRNISQAHPSFPDGTFLYFIDPPVPGPNLSGMFFWRYGSRVTVSANDSDQPARLKDHSVAFVYYFDVHGDPKEVRADNAAVTQSVPPMPVRFAEPLQLEGYELVSTHLMRDQPLLLFLYWRGQGRVGKDYTVFVHLIDSQGKLRVGQDEAPRHGDAPTSRWVPGQLIVDAVQMPVTTVPAGSYALELGLYDPKTLQRVDVLGPDGKSLGDRILIEPVSVSE